jgi:hypothetical protein
MGIVLSIVREAFSFLPTAYITNKIKIVAFNILC